MMGKNNPFIHRGPIRDHHYFYGRQHEIEQIFALLGSTQSVSVVGPRRIGKSSLLLHLANPAVFEQHGLRPEACCFVYIACESWADLERNELYGLILQELRETLAVAPHPIELDVTPVTAVTYRVLEQAIRTVVGQKIRVIFLLDDLEAFSTNPHLDAHFFSSLRGLATQHGVAYLTTSTELLYDLTYPQTNVLSSPFFNFFAQLRLHPFARAEAEMLLTGLATRAGLTFSPTLVNFLYDLAGPHPFFLQLAGYYAFDLMARKDSAFSEADQEQVRLQFWLEAEPHWRYFWHKLSRHDQKYLALLCAAAQPEVKRLAEAGLVVREGDTVQPISLAFRDFVGRQPIDGLLQAPPVTLDCQRQTVLLRGQPLHLSPTLFNLLTYLVERADQVISHEELEQAVWPEDKHIDDPDRLRKVIQALRQALNDEIGRLIWNVRGMGYKFAPVQ